MRCVGDTCNVRITGIINDKRARVIDEENNIEGYLLIKGKLKLRSDGTVRAWLLKVDREKDEYIFGNSYFGKYSIPDSISKKYISAIEKILGYSKETVNPDDISLLKGMVNRCLKKDQWDWYTTLSYMGYPAERVLNSFVKDSISLRKDLISGKTQTLAKFVSLYQFMLISIYSHLTNYEEIDDERIDIPISGFEKQLWDKLLYDSRKNIIIAEQLNNQISKYLLMHYFVTLEQEFQNNYLAPFQRAYADQIRTFRLHDPRWKITHDILCENTHFSLGAVFYHGRCCSRRTLISASDSICCFVEYLGGNRQHFVELCNLISEKRICGYTLKDMRNGLAHGDSAITNAIDQSAYDELRSFLLKQPECVLKRILIYSMNN